MTDLDLTPFQCGTASESLLYATPDDVVRKAKVTGPQFRASSSKPKLSGERTITYVASDETPDRVGDVIKVSGWQLDNYKKNPVILWGHDGTSIPPIGRASNIRRGDGPGGNRALLASIEFAPAEVHSFADTVYQLAANGFVRAVSVGFLPVEHGEIDDRQRAKLGMPSYGVLYTKASLLEVSVVSVPANPAALVTSTKSLVDQGVIAERSLNDFIKSVPLSEADAYDRLKARLRSFVDMGAFKAAPNELKVGDMVSWNSSGGRAQGKIERVVRDGEIDVPDSSFTITGSEDDPAALIRVYRDDEPTDRRVGHKFSTLTKIKSMNDQTETPADDTVETPEPEQPQVEGKDAMMLKEVSRHLRAAMSLLDGATAYYDNEDEKQHASVERLIEAQANQARALTSLVDSISDLTARVHLIGEGEGGTKAVPAPEPSDADDQGGATEKQLENAVTDFMSRLSDLIQ